MARLSIRPVFLLLIGTLPSVALGNIFGVNSKPEREWDGAQTLHFTIRRQTTLMDKALHAKLERIYRNLHRELFSLSPWMATEKVEVYVYANRNYYAKGMFRPPPWSGGLARLSSNPKAPKQLALFKPVRDKITAHELVHLYFHSFFVEKGKFPPRWLDEGLASMLEEHALKPPNPRYRGPRIAEPIPLKRFFTEKPANDSPQARVSLWYAQAHSLVLYLKKAHSDFKFTRFCKELRDGEPLDSAFRRVYGFSSYDALFQKWRQWTARSDRR